MPSDSEGKGFLSSAQAGVSLLRDALLLGLFLLLVLAPATLNGILTRAGFTKASILGFDWQARVEAAERETVAAKQEAERMGQQLSEYAVRLEQVGRSATEPAAREQARMLAAEIRGVQATADQLGARLDRNLVVQRELNAQLKARLR